MVIREYCVARGVRMGIGELPPEWQLFFFRGD